MKNSKYCLFLFLVCLILTGCGNVNSNNKELTDEEKLCQNIYPSIEKYQNNQITYNELLDSIKNDYNNYCIDSNNNVCVFIKSMYTSEETSLELQDCSNLSGNAKSLCETTNNAKKEMVSKKTDVQKASVNNLKISCESIANN